MFKKIEIWILYLVIILGIIFALTFGVLVRQELEGTTSKGGIDISFLSKPAANIARLPEKFLRELTKPNPLMINNSFIKNRDFFNQNGFSGDANNKETYLLLSRYDGDIESGVVELIDLTNFEKLHSWDPDIDTFNSLVDKTDEFKYLTRDANDKRQVHRHAKLLSDGNLLIGGGTPLRKIDPCGNLIFQNTHDNFHHSIETDVDGNIWGPTYIYPQTLPEKIIGREHMKEGGFLDDGIVKLSPEDGKILYEKSVSQIFIDNQMEYLLFGHGNDYERDPIHLNDIQPVDFNGEFWKKGDVFLSLRSQSMILLYRPSTNKIIWKGVGPFFHQHDVNILDDHRISIFNNNSINVATNKMNDIKKVNEVIIYNFKTNTYTSYLKDSLVRADVRSIEQGRSKILPNGDLFVEETNFGRTLYFNSDGSLRWSHVNLANNGNVYTVAWSRILFTNEDIKAVKNLLKNKWSCSE